MAGKRWSIGQLARASGLTVRTLYHYDEIGLVSAGERTAAGHRRYTEADLRRLYRVRALRGLGLSLEKIATVLHDGAENNLTTLQGLLSAQLTELDAHAKRIADLRNQVDRLLAQLTDSAMPDADQFLTALELASMAETYFSREQRDALSRTTTADTIRAEVLGLLKEIRQCQLDGIPVDDPRVQALTRSVDGIGTAVHGGDHRLLAAANKLWQDNRIEISRSLDLPAPADGPDVVDYLRRARQIRRAT